MSLAVLSFAGFYHTAPRLISVLMAPEHGFRATVCYNAQWYGHGYCGALAVADRTPADL